MAVTYFKRFRMELRVDGEFLPVATATPAPPLRARCLDPFRPGGHHLVDDRSAPSPLALGRGDRHLVARDATADEHDLAVGLVRHRLTAGDEPFGSEHGRVGRVVARVVGPGGHPFEPRQHGRPSAMLVA